MTGNDGDERRWTIGELAKATGVTIRTLYHYDEIGLVQAGERTASGHRRYTGADLRQLYRVRALRGLGLSLEEIANVLARPVDDLTAMRGLLAAQLAELDLQTARIGQLKQRLDGLVGLLDQSVMPDPEQFMTTLEMISVYESYFGQEVRDDLAKRRMQLGADALERFRAEWLVLLREAREHMLADTPVDDPRVREVATRWEALATALQSGDQQVDQRTQAAGMAFWRDNSAGISEEISRQIDWLDAGDLPAIMTYFERVRKARDEHESGA
ncbi:MerR family transcriptional regulator [Nonomuraea guangzhouensis]|uniref:MerR family transcriptional regulator n=1 Tax=Nonomuraea guangzhouensis TaxID=1291555 RepID=A0ABW4GRK9_9ACTN|nr:MerR family transcriptional regulator [Nonomuraea guangzhouensis]